MSQPKSNVPALHRISVHSWGEQDVQHDPDGRFVFWQDVEDLVADAAALIARIEMASPMDSIPMHTTDDVELRCKISEVLYG